ncbi:MAG: site-specific DNA-methyltransferase [Holdemanella porci]
MDRIESLSLNLEKNNIDKIKELFPEAVEEGKINFDMLRAMLGDEVDDSKEKYQFTWNGKSKAIKLAQTPSSATLRPCKDKSKNWDTTENIYIEGDNLEVLKQLQKTYYGKIKMIYIDPPYNTGNDFVYNDSFSNSLDNYKEQTNQSSSSNPESNGRFHTDWLNMMYPRLILAKNLLSNDGLIFISIGQGEQVNLEKICNEIFGESNHITTFVWKNKYGPGAFTKGVASLHEYVLCYGKKFPDNIETDLSEDEAKKYKLMDDKFSSRGGYITQPLATKSKGDRPNLVYPLVHNGVEIWPDKQWIWEKKRLYKAYENDELVINENNGKYSVRFKQYLKDEYGVMRKGKPLSLLTMCFNQDGTKEVQKELGNGIFDFPKPTALIKYLISLIINSETDNDYYVLDFFSGSGSTADAIMQLNNKDNGKRKFIMVQIPENCQEKSIAFKNGYKNICEIGEERIRRAGVQIKTDWEKEHPSDGLFGSEEKFTTDIGFKVFKLDSTNVNEWDPDMKLDEKELAMRLGEVFKEGRSKEDILYEIMLKYGVFDKQVEEINVNGKIMYRVGKRYMIVCLEDSITSEDIKAIGELSPKTVIFNEAGFNNDNDKINAVYNLEKCGVEDVKCI